LLRVRPVLLPQEEIARRLAVILHYAATFGGLGAKTQNGFGQIAVLEFPDFQDRFASGLRELQGLASGCTYTAGEFSLHPDRFFSLVYRLDEDPYVEGTALLTVPEGFAYSYIPCAFDLKPSLRASFGPLNTEETFGSGGGQAQASRVHLSHLYTLEPRGQYHLKIWGDLDQKVQAVAAVKAFAEDRFGPSAHLEREYP